MILTPVLYYDDNLDDASRLAHFQKLADRNVITSSSYQLFTREEVTDIPKLHGPNYPDITDLGISTEGVEKLLSNLNVSMASRPDLIPCRLLKGLAEEIAPILAEIFRQSLRDGVISSIWKKIQTWPQFLRKGAGTQPKIID